MNYSGIIYRRFIINDRGEEMSYVGQTCDPVKRNNDFLNLNVTYSGVRIENARRKYGPENFGYEVLEEVTCEEAQELARRLDELEIYYIAFYNSFEHGYNNALGGSGANGYQHTEEYKQWQSEQSKILNADPDIKRRQKEGMAAYFNKPGSREKRTAELLRRYEDMSEREKLSIAQKKSYAANPQRAISRNKALSITCSTAEGRKRMGQTSHEAWQKEEYRKKQQERMHKQWSDPAFLAAYKERNKGMNGKKVLQYTLSEEFVAEYISACEAARIIGVPTGFGSICRVCRGDRKSYKGYLWKYKEEDEETDA